METTRAAMLGNDSPTSAAGR